AAGALVALVLVTALVFFAQKAREFSSAEHERFQTALWRLKQLDTAFNEGVLEARFSLVSDYDDLQDYERELQSSLDELKRAPGFIGPPGRVAIEQARLGYLTVLQERQRLFERFKSENASLANSRRYLPLALDQLALRMAAHPEDPELQAVVGDLTRLTL